MDAAALLLAALLSPVDPAHVGCLPPAGYSAVQAWHCQEILGRLDGMAGVESDPVGRAWLDTRRAQARWQREWWTAAMNAAWYAQHWHSGPDGRLRLLVYEADVRRNLDRLRRLAPLSYPREPPGLWHFP